MTELFRASLAQGEQRDIAARRYVGRIAVEQLSECSPGGRRQLRLPLFLFLGVGGRRLSLEDRDVIDSVVREPRTQRLGCRRFEVSRDALAVEVAAADDPAIKPIGLVQTDDERAGAFRQCRVQPGDGGIRGTDLRQELLVTLSRGEE